jgi:hypothetical protein
MVLAATIAVATFELVHVGKQAVEQWSASKAAEHILTRQRLDLDREIFERTHPKPVAPSKREVVVPPEIEAQLADAPEWEREDTRARAIELYEDLDQKSPDEKPQDRWGRVHKLLELETEAVESSV